MGLNPVFSRSPAPARHSLSARVPGTIMIRGFSRRSSGLATLPTAILILASAVLTGQAVAGVSTDPAEVRLVGPSVRRLILVTGTTGVGARVDLTRSARFRVLASGPDHRQPSAMAPQPDPSPFRTPGNRDFGARCRDTLADACNPLLAASAVRGHQRLIRGNFGLEGS